MTGKPTVTRVEFHYTRKDSPNGDMYIVYYTLPNGSKYRAYIVARDALGAYTRFLSRYATATRGLDYRDET
jgi:hypothetical protein